MIHFTKSLDGHETIALPKTFAISHAIRFQARPSRLSVFYLPDVFVCLSDLYIRTKDLHRNRGFAVSIRDLPFPDRDEDVLNTRPVAV